MLCAIGQLPSIQGALTSRCGIEQEGTLAMKSILSRAGVTVAGIFVAFGASAVLATVANASEVEPVADGCVYAGQQYSEGAIVKVGDLYIQCTFGQWSRI
jgi:hypothetical protein